MGERERGERKRHGGRITKVEQKKKRESVKKLKSIKEEKERK